MSVGGEGLGVGRGHGVERSGGMKGQVERPRGSERGMAGELLLSGWLVNCRELGCSRLRQLFVDRERGLARSSHFAFVPRTRSNLS